MSLPPTTATPLTPLARLDAVFAAHRASGRAVLAPFVTAGDPDADTSEIGRAHV